MCGNDTCDPLYARGVIALPACCVPDTQACGSDVRPASSYLGRAIGPAHSCQAKNQPGVPDPACPTSDVSVVALAPCCKPNGHCGLFTNDVLGVDLGLGCVDPTELGIAASPDGGATPSCNYPEGGAPAFDLDASSIH